MSNPSEQSASPTAGPPILNELDAFLATGAPPRSWVAWTGFVLGVLLLVPWVAISVRTITGSNSGLVIGSSIGLGGGVLAALLGIAGIFHTRKRARRGRAVAIAAIPLGVVGGFFQMVIGMFGYTMLTLMAEGDQAVRLLRASSIEAVAIAETWRTEHGSQRFQASVSAEAMAGWLNDVLAEHGQLQSATPNRKKNFEQVRGAWVYRLNGQFVNGTTPIALTMGFEADGTARIDDIEVDGSSPRDWILPKTE